MTRRETIEHSGVGKVSRLLVSDHLDMTRGVAARAVLVYHVRYRFFLDYSDLSSSTIVSKLFYIVTAFGHDAVMVFFVLSGYFISASVIRDNKRGRWSWGRYGISRATRLYVVLLPALALTAGWDLLGLHLFGESVIYTGQGRPWLHDFFPVENRLAPHVAVGNAVFLQMITVPPFGSNTPLWSLSFEWWYYALFPLAWVSLKGSRSLAGCVIQLSLFATILFLISREMLLYFPIWLMGTCVALLPRISPFGKWQSTAHTLAAAFGFCGIVTVCHLGPVKELFGNSVIAIDYVTGVCFSMLLYFMLHNEQAGVSGLYSRTAVRLAGLSYTLYLVHMPFLVFLRAAFISDYPWSPDVRHIFFAVLIAAAAFAYSYVVAYFTEAKTSRYRDRALAWFGLERLDGGGPVSFQLEPIESRK